MSFVTIALSQTALTYWGGKGSKANKRKTVYKDHLSPDMPELVAVTVFALRMARNQLPPNPRPLCLTLDPQAYHS